jgi:hypothetical protein
MEKSNHTELIVRVPDALRSPEILGYVEFGIRQLALGESPSEMPYTGAKRWKNTRIRLSPKTCRLLANLEPEYGSKRAVITAALHITAVTPQALRYTS